MPTSLRRMSRFTVAGLFLVSGSVPSIADQFYKCNVNGKVTYQAAPCKEGKSNQIETHNDLSEAEMKAAQERANREKFNASAGEPSSSAPANSSAAPKASGKPDCSGLSAQREQAYARRNSALASARQGDGVTAGSAGDVAIAGMQAEVQSIESRMRASGCSF